MAKSNNPAADLARKRWNGKTPDERKQIMRQVQQARRDNAAARRSAKKPEK